MHDARALGVAHEREGLVGAGCGLREEARDDVVDALFATGDDLRTCGVLGGVLAGRGGSVGGTVGAGGGVEVLGLDSLGCLRA